MRRKIRVSAPSRLCLFGEHQDYLGLEVVAAAIDLRFVATAVENGTKVFRMKIRSETESALGVQSTHYTNFVFDVSRHELPYYKQRDYLASSFNIVRRLGFPMNKGWDITIDADVPIGKGMSSSSVMIVTLIKLLLELLDAPQKDDPETLAQLAYAAEVLEFHEPGGMMDHYCSAYGGVLYLDFKDNQTAVERLPIDALPGRFLLFDSLQEKDTLNVLANSKFPVLTALEHMELPDFRALLAMDHMRREKQMAALTAEEAVKINASLKNAYLLRQGLDMLRVIPEDNQWNVEFGNLLQQHHDQLRDGLGISTAIIERAMTAGRKAGAYGGKINGSGGGGCAYLYCHPSNCAKVKNALEAIGHPVVYLNVAPGAYKESDEMINI